MIFSKVRHAHRTCKAQALIWLMKTEIVLSILASLATAKRIGVARLPAVAPPVDHA
jgi:hypothetical protein